MRTVLATLLALALLPPVALWTIGSEDELERANRLFGEHSYKPALEAYELALNDAERSVEERGHALLQSVHCLVKLKRWDDAIALSKKDNPLEGTIWNARLVALRGSTSLTMPHYFYKKGKQISRQGYIQGGTYHYTYYDDLVAALKDLEAAAGLFTPFLEKGILPPDSAELKRRVSDFAGVCSGMASALESHREQRGGFEGLEVSPDVLKEWTKHGVGGFLKPDPQAWLELAEKTALRFGNRDIAARARYLDAMYCRRLMDDLSVDSTRWQGDSCKVTIECGGTQEDPVLADLPDSMNPFLRFPSLLKDYKDSVVEDDGTYVFAMLCNRFGNFLKALDLVKNFERRFPRSSWRSDVLALAQEIRHPVLKAQDVASSLPGTRPGLTLNIRNVKTIDVRVYSIDLAQLYTDPDYLRDSRNAFNATQRFARFIRKARLRRTPAAAPVTLTTPDRGAHQSHSMKVSVDVAEAGAYLVEIDGVDISWRTIVCVSDLAIVRKFTPDETLLFVADARSGAPVEGAQVLVRQRQRRQGIFGTYDRVTHGIGKTDVNGFHARTHVSANNNRIYIEAFAELNGRFAMTSFNRTNPRRGRPQSHVVYGFTDRPVYRPGNTIGFVGNIRNRDGAEYVGPVEEPLTVLIKDPKGNKIMEEALETDEFGAVHGSVVLGEEPPLGFYRIEYSRKGRQIGRHGFQVEEFKKPEFEVLVKGPTDQVRMGQPFEATIHSEYYAGGGVPEASVSYRVYRRRHYPRFNRSDPYSYLYGARLSSNPGGGARELVRKGKGVTDANGDLVLKLESSPWEEKYPETDHRFVVEADVTDLSRRTISGSGVVLVTRRALAVDVVAGRGFYRAGENVELEFRCQRPDGTPQASKGRVIFYRVTARREDGEIVLDRKQIHTADASTDNKGMGFHSWVADTPGHFAIAYVTEDKWGEACSGELALWITSPGYRADDFQFKNIEIVTDRREYAPGDTAFVLINNRFADSTVFFTLEADREVISRDVLRATGKTHVLAIPITTAHTPNVWLHALMVKNGAFYQASREIFVPPLQKFMDVDLTFDRDVYLPGDKARVTLVSKDAKGDPVDARVSLSVFDKSITYIRADSTADIRRFFYGARRTFYGRSGWNSNTSNSLQFRFSGYETSSPDLVRYRRHGTPMGWSNDPGEHGLMWSVGKKTEWSEVPVTIDAEVEELEDEAFDGMSLNDAIGLGGGASGSFGSRRGGRRMAKGAGGRASPGSPLSQLKEKDRSNSPLDKPVFGQNAESLGERYREVSEPRGDEVSPGLRVNFSDLATWQPALRTGDDGRIQVEFALPDSLTTWVATARGLTRDTLVGQARVEVKTTKNLRLRLQSPRFFTERDEIMLSGVIRNEYDTPLQVRSVLGLSGGAVKLVGDPEQSIELPPHGESRVDWLVKVVDTGSVTVIMKSFSKRESDAVAMTFPAYCYGIDRVVTLVGDMKNGGDLGFELDVPEARNVGSTLIDVTLSPSIAASLLEALPYLVEYPYGCTEQTMSRFLPAAVVARTLGDLGFDLEDIARSRRELANRDDLNARALAPVYSSRRLNSIVDAGIKRLMGMQNPDGGFGWWSQDGSSVHLSSYVLHGLGVARSSGQKIPGKAIERVISFLEKRLPDLRSLQEASYACYALTSVGRKPAKAMTRVMNSRDDLTVQGKAQLALALKWSGREGEARLVLRNLEDFVQEDQKNGTCHWASGGRWWRWYDDEIETNAYVLFALAECSPDSRYAGPLARWLVYNRTGNRWKSTRDTATAVMALARFAANTGEFDPNYTLKVKYGSQPERTIRVTRDNMFAFDNHITIQGDAVLTGSNMLSIQMEGRGTLYANARLSYFSKEDRIRAAGHQLEVRREYYALTPIEREERRGEKTVKVLDWKRDLISDLDTISSGQEVEVRLTVTAANNYEYVMLEDRKPAGFEPVALRSGRRYGNGLCSNMELRDEKVVFFVSWLQQGSHEISYRMRAEIPGTVNAMPCRVEAMYAPRLGGISDSFRVSVSDTAR